MANMTHNVIARRQSVYTLPLFVPNFISNGNIVKSKSITTVGYPMFIMELKAKILKFCVYLSKIRI